MNNKIGVCEWCLPVWGPDAIYFAADVGFEGVQLTDLGGPQKGFPMTNELIREGYKEASERTGVVLHSMHLHSLPREGGMIYPLDSPKGEATKLALRNGIDSCEAMGIGILNISVFLKSAIKNDYDFRNFIASLRYAVDYAKDHGVLVVYEPSVSLEKTLEILELVPDIKINHDLLNRSRRRPEKEIPALVKVIDHVHIKDATRDEFGMIAGPCLAGDGTGKVREQVKMLNDLGYDNWYLSESDYIRPKFYNLGDDLSYICRTDLNRIRELVNGEGETQPGKESAGDE